MRQSQRDVPQVNHFQVSICTSHEMRIVIRHFLIMNATQYRAEGSMTGKHCKNNDIGFVHVSPAAAFLP